MAFLREVLHLWLLCSGDLDESIRLRETQTIRLSTCATVAFSQTNPTVKLYTAEGQLHKLRTFRSSNLALAPDENTANCDETTWAYNLRNQLERKEYADGKGTDYTYTPGGKLLTRTWARGITTTYGYNSAGELTTTDYSDSTLDVTITPDKLGRQQSITNGVATSVFAYDPATLALDTETITYNLPGQPAFTRVLDRSRDSLGRDTGYTLGTPSPSLAIETQATYTYEATTGRLGTVSGGALQAPSPFTYSYVPNSSLIATVTGPVHTVTNTWEPDRDVLDLKENKVGNTLVSSYDYTVNVLGQRTNVTTSGTAFPATPSWVWGYDSLGQVVSADSTENTHDRAYQYDAIGNRKKSADSLTLPGSDNYTSNPVNQYTAVNGGNPVHDHDGNLVSGQVPTGSAGLVWDAENRLIAVSVIGQDTIHYAYDSQSRRISRSVGVSPTASSTLYIYDAWNPIAEYQLQSSSFDIHTSYLWGTDLSGTLQGAGGVGGLLSINIHDPQSTIYYPLFDGNGNVSEYLDGSGQVAAHFEYDPFGNTVVNTDTNNQFAYRFSTKPLDQVTGLYYYGYRYYDPLTGRWPSRDRIGILGGMNFYGFVSNHPVNIHDLLGLASNDDQAKKISECEAAKKIALNTAEVKPYLDKINSHKPPCPFAPKCDCCEREGEEGNTSANGTVVICANKSVDKEKAVKVLMHELTHVIQNCFDEPRKDPCDDCLCREIQAYMTDPDLKDIDPDALKKILAISAAGSCMRSKEGGGYTPSGCGIKYQIMQDAIDHALKLVDQCSKSPL